MFPWKAAKAAVPALCLALAALAPAARAGADACAAREAAPAPDSCPPVLPSAPARAPAAPRPGTGDPFMAAALGLLPLASGFYVSSSPVKGVAFTLSDLMLIGAILQAGSDPLRTRKDVETYYWLMAGANLADAVLSALQVRSDAAKRLSVNVNPSDRPGLVLGWRF